MTARILSAGVVVLHRVGDHYNYLLLRAYDYWDFPKGMVEPGESPFACAVREVAEETTIQDLRFRWGRVYRQTAPYNHGRKVARYYIAETEQVTINLPVNPSLGRPEHSDYCWANRQQAWNLLTPRVQAVLRWSDRIIEAAACARRSTGEAGRQRQPPRSC